MFAISACLVAILGSFGPARAHESTARLLVLAKEPPDRIVARHGPLPGLAAGISTFGVSPRDYAAIAVGARIVAEADADVVPARLSAVRTLGRDAALTGPPPAPAPNVLREVHHLSIGENVPAPPFVDQTGRPFTMRDLAGGPVVLAFIYTHCRDARECPLVSAKFGELQRAFAGTTTHLVLVTIDPANDTPPVLAAYARTFGARPDRWRFATGDPDVVLDFAAQFDVTAFPDERVGLIHPERTIVLDRYGAIRDMIDESSWSPSEIVAAVRQSERLGSSPFARLNLWLSQKAVAICGNGVAGFSGFVDALLVVAIVGFFSWLLWRVGTAIARGTT